MVGHSRRMRRRKFWTGMTEKRPPPPDWGNDPLSVFFRDAEYNQRAVAVNFQKVYELLGQVDSLFQKSEIGVCT